jgi:hypothetical protein
MLRWLGMMLFLIGSLGSLLLLVTHRPSGGDLRTA